MYIGIIDSGVGGLSFLNGIKNNNDKYIIIMDKKYFPYGNKTEVFLLLRTIYLCEFLFSMGVSKIILACNTLSLIVLDSLNKIYGDKVSGVFELFKSIDINSNTLYLGSYNATLAFKKRYSCNTLCMDSFIYKLQQNLDVSSEIEEVKSYLKKYEKVLFGCTHFIKVKKEFNYINAVFQDDLYNKSHIL